jgi:hypothetical protein
MKIYKYPLQAAFDGMGASWHEIDTILMPEGAKILSVGIQGDNHPVLWALVDPDKPFVPRILYVVGTGHEMGKEFLTRRFIGTLIFGNGGIILHVWE